MLYEIVHRFPKDMIQKGEGPLISLYQPTHRSFPDNKQDPIVFKNLLREIENSLKQKISDEYIDSIMKPFYELKEDQNFWNNTADGIAVLANQNKCIVYNLYNPVQELAIVANSFHIKPLLQAFQSLENYLLLGLSRENFTLYQGNRHGFHEITIDPEIPRTLQDVLGHQLSDASLSNGSFAGAGGPAMYYGQGDVKEEIDKDTEKYFRHVDAFVLENYSKPSKLPLILVSLKEYHTEFKKLSKNPYLLDEGINQSIESLDMDEIQTKARVIIEAINLAKIQTLADAYGKAEAESLGSSDLVKVTKAANESRVETILIEEDKMISGETDNTLDDLAELVLLNGGTVIVLPKDKMPSATGVAAIYRYN